MALSITYVVTGVQRNGTRPGFAVPVSDTTAESYQVSIQLEPDPTQPNLLNGIPQFQINVPKEALAKYLVDATGTIVFNDPS